MSAEPSEVLEGQSMRIGAGGRIVATGDGGTARTEVSSGARVSSSGSGTLTIRKDHDDAEFGVQIDADDAVIRMSQPSGPVRERTGAADLPITIADDAGEHRAWVSAGRGTVVLTLPDDFNARLDLEITRAGTGAPEPAVASDWPLRIDQMVPAEVNGGPGVRITRAHAVVGDAHGVVRVHVTNGNLIIRRAQSREAP